jgi:hypothetical protein
VPFVTQHSPKQINLFSSKKTSNARAPCHSHTILDNYFRIANTIPAAHDSSGIRWPRQYPFIFFTEPIPASHDSSGIRWPRQYPIILLTNRSRRRTTAVEYGGPASTQSFSLQTNPAGARQQWMVAPPVPNHVLYKQIHDSSGIRWPRQYPTIFFTNQCRQRTTSVEYGGPTVPNQFLNKPSSSFTNQLTLLVNFETSNFNIFATVLRACELTFLRTPTSSKAEHGP